ncbi:MAG TPA: LamG-like jellyroll fold domain-containing protein [Verrucomicrobiae bacterium]
MKTYNIQSFAAGTLRNTICLAVLAAFCAPVSAQPARLIAYWNFDDASNPTQAVATVGGFVGTFTNNVDTDPSNMTNNPVYTADGGGFSALPGDRALDFGVNQVYRLMRSTDIAAALNLAAASDRIAVTFHQKWNTGTAGSSSFWMTSPSSSGNWRGFQAHCPYGGNTIYFDTAGCCTAGTQRLSGGVGVNYQMWHLFAFLKNGDTKQVVVDGAVMLQSTGASALPADFTEVLVGAAFVWGAPTATVANNMQGLIDDFAVWEGAITASQMALLASGMSPVLVGTDTDGDGLPDGWETKYGLNPNSPLDATQDTDSDGLTNLQEFAKGTDPRNPDTDQDGYMDGVETGYGFFTSTSDTGTDPLNPDTDGDLVPDGAEKNTGIFVSAADTGTNPTVWDTDSDGFGDGAEVALGNSPVNAASTPTLGTGARILAYWNFNDTTAPTQAVDQVHNLVAFFTNGVIALTNGRTATTEGAVYTADGRGYTGKPGDRAIDFGTNSAQRVVRSRAIAPYLQAAAALDPSTGLSDAISLSFWQKWSVVPVGSSTFWIRSPSAGSGDRGMQAHNPNGGAGGTVYFDTAGCCATPAQRLNGTAPAGFDWQKWHHFAFVKNGGMKQVWMDGKLVLNLDAGASPLPADFTELIIGASYPGFAAQFLGLVDDFAVYGSGLTTNQIEALAYGLSPLDVDQATGDADGDGMPDWWETFYGFNKNNPADAAQDTDSDGLTNFQEYQRKTNPLNPDTDGDGLRDGVETGTGIWTSATDTGTDPLNPDVDGDGLLDGAETRTGVFVSAANTGSDPYLPDTDFDGYGDFTEVLLGSSPVNFSSIPIQIGAVNLLAYWDFNSPSVTTQAVDRIHSLVGVFERDAAYSGDGLGRTGHAGDRAVDLGTNGTALVRNIPGQWLSAVAANNALSVSFWQKWTTPIVNSFAFYGVSLSSVDNFRGLSAHTPWSDGTVYWDTGGSTAGSTRISANISTIAPYVPGYTDANGFFVNKWHHFVFLKNGDTKQIWIDGVLFLEAANTTVLASDFTQFLMGGTPFEDTSFRGLMDDFAIYASALDPTNITALAQGGSPIDFSVPARLTISRQVANQITLDWTATGYILQTNAVIDNVAGWADVPGATSGSVTESLPSTGSTYYRLRKQ